MQNTYKYTLALAAALPLLAANRGSEVTFYRDVLPVVQKNCQNCHRPGEAAPMSFLTYKDTRPWAKAMKEAVLKKKMPPWFADPHVGTFVNDRSMPQADIDTIVKWADTGATEGDTKQAPAPLTFAEGWAIGKPDAVFELPESFTVPASGTIEYTYFIVPTGFTEDKWVKMAEARPGDRTVVHHIIAFIREPGSKWMRDYPVNKAFVPQKSNRGGGEGGGGGLFLAGYAPGAPPVQLRPGQAALVKAGSDVVFQMHYTTSGKQAIDRSRVGLVFATEPVKQRVLTLGAQNNKFVIPPNNASFAVDGAMTLHADAELVNLFPHMHLRGKSMEMRAVYPDGKKEKLLWVPGYDFSWQLWYEVPAGKMLPAGTRIEATGTFDNSANNKHNPDPNVEVRWGDQSWEEMMIGFFNVAIDVNMNPQDLVKPKKQAPPSSGAGAE